MEENYREKSLTDLDMARALLRLVWQSFDTGGESKRSNRSRCLEAAMSLFGPTSKEGCEAGDTNRQGLLLEGERRVRDRYEASSHARLEAERKRLDGE